MVVLDRSFLERLYPDLETRSTFNLSDKGITSVAPGTFAGLTLTRLDLSGNQITLDSLARLPNVTYLDLSRNKIGDIAPNSFDRFPNITYLDLSGNQIGAIAPSAFARLPNITSLYLNSNQLTLIAPDTFAELSNLAWLTLNRNCIATLAPGTFAGLPSLVHLFLYNNHLTSLAPGTFTGLPSLVHLFLYNNHLTSLAPGTFTGLPSLTTLSLSCNQLTFLAPGTFAELPSSAVLYLYDNQLTELTFDTLKYTCHAEPFLIKPKGEIANDTVVEAMAALYPDANVHLALASVSQLQKLAVFKSDHRKCEHITMDRNGYVVGCSPLRVRLLLLCKYVRDAYELERYRYCSAEQLQRLFHLRAKLARTAKNPLGDRLPEELVRHLCAM